MLAAAAGAEASAAPTCRLDPALEDVGELCEQGFGGPNPFTCPTLRVLEHLVNDRRPEARRILGQELGFPDDSIDRLQPLLEFLSWGAIHGDSPAECMQAYFARGPLFDLLNGALRDSEQNILIGRLFGAPERVLAQLETNLGKPDTAKKLRLLAPALRRLLESTDLGWVTNGGIGSSPMFDLMFGSSALEDSASQDLADAEKASDGLDKARLLTRAGVRYTAAGSYDEALSALHRAGDLLAPPRDEEERALYAIGHWFLAMTYELLGMDDLRRQTIRESQKIAQGDAGEFLDAIGQSIFHRDFEGMNRFYRKMQDGKVDRDAIAPIFDAYETIFPEHSGTSGYAADAHTHPMDFYQLSAAVADHVMVGRYDEAMATIQQLNDKHPGYRMIYLMTIVATRQWLDGDKEGAAKNLRLAIDAIEADTGALEVDEIQSSLIDRGVWMLFLLAVEISAREGRAEEAFAYAERGRAWSTRRLLGAPRSSLRKIDPEMAQRGRELLAAVHRVEDDRRQAPIDRREALDQELTRRRSEFLSWRLGRKLAAADDRAPVVPPEIDLDQLREKILDPETALLVYAGGLEGVLWSWVVTLDRVDMVALEMPDAAQVLELREALPKSLRQGPRLDRTHQLLEELHGQLVAPLLGSIGGRQKLIVVPFGFLHHLPFAALRNPATRRYLAQDHRLGLAPSASSLANILADEPTSSTGQGTVFGDPDLDVVALEPLDHARQEAERVADLLATEPLVAARASEDALRRRAAETGWLHLAAHGTFDRHNPAFSRVWLAGGPAHDGRLEVHEVWDELELGNTRLVVLSACETALGEVTRGEEIVGLTQAFLVAGSRSVLSTLWRVDDAASEVLIGYFYESLKNGATAAEALASAQGRMIDHPDYAAPYFWAGYTLSGDPDIRWPADLAGPGRQRMLVLLGGSLATALLVLLALPRRFPPGLAVLCAGREDLGDGEIYYLRPASRSRGFPLRRAETYLAPRLGPRPRPEGAIARLRAGRRILLAPIAGHQLWRRDSDGTWTRLPPGERPMTPHTLYRNTHRTFYFELREG